MDTVYDLKPRPIKARKPKASKHKTQLDKKPGLSGAIFCSVGAPYSSQDVEKALNDE
jgi:hypothetical protein